MTKSNFHHYIFLLQKWYLITKTESKGKKTKQNKTKNNIRDTENYFQMRKVKSVFLPWINNSLNI